MLCLMALISGCGSTEDITGGIVDTENTTVELQIFADYHQFTLEDEKTGGGEPPVDWGAGISPPQLLAAAPGMVGVGIIRNVTVPVTVEVRDDEQMDGQRE